MPEQVNLNPDIRELRIGVREYRNVTVYPLSVRDQLKTTSIVVGAVSTFFSAYENIDMIPETDFAMFISQLVSGNMDPIIKMALADEPADNDPLADMTNRQLEELVRIVYEVNYSFLSSLLTKAVEKMKMVLPSKKLSPMSAIDTDTDPLSFIAGALKKEESPSDKH
jgi:hypothetical protein